MTNDIESSLHYHVDTVMKWRIMITIMPNALSQVCITEWTWHLLIFIENFSSNDTLSKIELLQ